MRRHAACFDRIIAWVFHEEAERIYEGHQFLFTHAIPSGSRPVFR